MFDFNYIYLEFIKNNRTYSVCIFLIGLKISNSYLMFDFSHNIKIVGVTTVAACN